jgi:iron complex transport system ATP-binding protein
VLATQAPVILADEPTVSLDARHQLVVLQLLRDAARRGGAILAVLHDLSLAARFADEVILMQTGTIVAHGQAKETLTASVIADAFGVDVAMIEMDGATIPVPRRPL